jgi:hypothetical protein
MNVRVEPSASGDFDLELVDALVDEAIALAIEEHRRLGNPIAVWRDGKVVWIPPEEIPPYTPPSSDTDAG